MTWRDLPRLGHTNVETVSKIWVRQAKWRGGHGRNQAVRRYGWFGGPIERLRGGDGWRYFVPAAVMVRLVGKEYPIELECTNDKAAYALQVELLRALNVGDPSAERIVAAAIQVRQWSPYPEPGAWVHMTYTLPAPARHPHILHAASYQQPEPLMRIDQGFLTSTGRYVGRKEAMGLALIAGQVDPATKRLPDLFTEDLW